MHPGERHQHPKLEKGLSDLHNPFILLVGREGIEPSTYWLRVKSPEFPNLLKLL